MSTKKGYKSVPWLFGKEIEIPEEWEVKSIKELGEIITGSTPDTNNKEYFDNDYLWASPSDLQKEKYVKQTNSMLSKKGLSISRKIPKDSVLVVCIGSTIGKIGMASMEMSTNQQINSIICNQNDSHFIYYQLLRNNYLIKNIANQVAVPILNKTDFGKLKFSMPTKIVEQQKIATILSNIDSLIESTSKIIENSKSLKTGLVQKLLTRGISHTKFKKVPWSFGKEIEIPEEWEVKKLNEITNKIGDGIHSTPEYVEHSEYYFINGNNLINGKITYFENTKNVSKEEFLKYELKLNENTILLSINGTIGNVAFYNKEKIILGKSASYIICNDKLNTLFLFYQLQSNLTKKYFSTQLTGTTISNLSLSSIRNMIFHLPLFPEQQKIASILSNIDAQIDSQTQYKDKLERLKKSLMQKLLTGEVRVAI